MIRPLYLLALLAVSFLGAACGSPTVNLNLKGNATVTLTFDLPSIAEVFKPYCDQLLAAQGNPDPSGDQLQACTDIMVSDFLAKVSSGKNTPVTGLPK